jgi:hypothetical protein
MFPRPIQTSLISLGIALSTLAVATAPAGAHMQPRDSASTSSLAGTVAPRQDLRSPDARDAATPAIDRAGRAQEQSYTSYGHPQPIQAPATGYTPHPIQVAATEASRGSSDVDWLPIGLAVVAAIGLAGIGVMTVKRRRRVGTAF